MSLLRKTVYLYGKADCGLCDRALSLLERVLLGHGTGDNCVSSVSLHKVDITCDQRLFERLSTRIPVLGLGDPEELAGGMFSGGYAAEDAPHLLLFWPFDEDQLRDFLSAL